MTPLSPQTQMTFKLAEVHDTSVQLLQMLDDDNITVGLGAVALALSFGRLLSPKVMSDEEEIQFIKSMLDFGGAFFNEGTSN